MIVFLCDLDDTLFSTQKKITNRDKQTLMSTLANGDPSGYATSRQMRLINLMLEGSEEHLFVPVTARSLDAYERVNLDAKVAILAQGGIILRNGVKDEVWAAKIKENARQQDSIKDVLEDIISLDKKWRHWPLCDDDVKLYYIIKHEESDIAAVETLYKLLKGAVPEGLSVHQNGNNIAIVPNWLSKKSSVDYLLKEIRQEKPDALTIGLGDSQSDLPFMMSCDYAVFPTQSQVANTVKENMIK